MIHDIKRDQSRKIIERNEKKRRNLDNAEKNFYEEFLSEKSQQ